MKKLFLYGAGSVGREVFDIADRINTSESRWGEIAFIDDTQETGIFQGKRVFQYCDFVKLFSPDEVEIAITNGEPIARKALYEKVRSDGYQLANVVDKTAIVSPSAQLGEGVIVYPFVMISSDSKIGDNVLIYCQTTVAHDSIIGEGSVLSIGVIVSGNCTISKYCFIGAGATIREKIEIGEWNIIAMSSGVCKSVSQNGIYMGNPAKRVKENTTRRVFK